MLLFSTTTGEPLAIMPDGVIQRLRVACANALGVKYMAPKNASVYALLGAGWQAEAQAIAVSLVRDLTDLRIYSPTPAKREKLAASLKEMGLPARAMDSVKHETSSSPVRCPRIVFLTVWAGPPPDSGRGRPGDRRRIGRRPWLHEAAPGVRSTSVPAGIRQAGRSCHYRASMAAA